MTTVSNTTYEKIYNRILAQLPPWFGNKPFVPVVPNVPQPTTNFNNIIWMYLITAFNAYGQLQYDWLQERIGAYELKNDPNWPTETPVYSIATGNNLDLIAQDFFGNNLTRRPDESDDNFRNRILSNVMRLKATRPAMLAALINLVTPVFAEANPLWSPLPLQWYPEIYEGWYPFDNGGYNDYQALAYGTQGGPNGAGGFGSNQPYSCLITVYLPIANGLGGYPGYATQGETITWGVGYGGGSDIPPNGFGSDSLLNYYITESDLLNTIALTKVLGTLCTLQIIYVS